MPIATLINVLTHNPNLPLFRMGMLRKNNGPYMDDTKAVKPVIGLPVTGL